MLTLEPQELRQLTGKARRADQCKWLDAHGIPYRQDGERVLVSRNAADKWLAGVDVPQTRGFDLAKVS